MRPITCLECVRSNADYCCYISDVASENYVRKQQWVSLTNCFDTGVRGSIGKSVGLSHSKVFTHFQLYETITFPSKRWDIPARLSPSSNTVNNRCYSVLPFRLVSTSTSKVTELWKIRRCTSHFYCNDTNPSNILQYHKTGMVALTWGTTRVRNSLI
jgi:hypothetical protein